MRKDTLRGVDDWGRGRDRSGVYERKPY